MAFRTAAARCCIDQGETWHVETSQCKISARSVQQYGIRASTAVKNEKVDRRNHFKSERSFKVIGNDSFRYERVWTEVIQSTKTYERRGSPGRKQRWQLLTDTDGVGVWPNVSSWIRDESRSRSRTEVRRSASHCN